MTEGKWLHRCGFWMNGSRSDRSDSPNFLRAPVLKFKPLPPNISLPLPVKPSQVPIVNPLMFLLARANLLPEPSRSLATTTPSRKVQQQRPLPPPSGGRASHRRRESEKKGRSEGPEAGCPLLVMELACPGSRSRDATIPRRGRSLAEHGWRRSAGYAGSGLGILLSWSVLFFRMGYASWGTGGGGGRELTISSSPSSISTFWLSLARSLQDWCEGVGHVCGRQCGEHGG